MSITAILNDVQAETQQQEEKWGEQNHKPFKWLAILTEEVGEVAEAILNLDWAENATNRESIPVGWQLQARELRAEAIQVAAVAISFIDSLERNGYIEK